MMRILVLIFALCVVLTYPGIADAKPRCKPSQKAGWVSEILIQQVGAKGKSPARSAKPEDVPLAENEILCAYDEIINPIGSGRTVILRLTGGRYETLLPDQRLTIDQPSELSRFKDFVDDHLGEKKFNDSIKEGATRGPAEDPLCTYKPVLPEHFTKAVKELGAVRLSWACGGEAEKIWEILINSDGMPEGRFLLKSNYFDLNVSSCNGSCMIYVQALGDRKPTYITSLQIIPLKEAKIPKSVLEISDNNVRNAVIGGIFLNRPHEGGWHAQGATLLYNSGCVIPAAGEIARRYYGYPYADEVCQPSPDIILRTR